MHFKVDANIMHAIFLHSPAVHKAYQQLVPVKMTEKEFWTKYDLTRQTHAGTHSASHTISCVGRMHASLG